MVKQITLFFQSTRISFVGTADQIRAQRYDFSQFGDVIGGEGEGWESVVRGYAATKARPNKDDVDG